MLRFVKILLVLTKARVTAAVTLSTATGFVLFANAVTVEIAAPILGVFLLACGACALNQVQERRIDARMARTRDRPLPAAQLDPAVACYVAVTLMLLGVYFLATIDRHLVTILALAGFALVWYNGVYTYLKRVSVFAVVPGALVGAVPVLIGWSAAGGVATDLQIMLVGAFFVFWQIPHFWLLVLLRGPEYEQAGLPTLQRLFGRDQLCRLTFAWLCATAAAGIVVGVVGRTTLPWNLAALAAGGWLVGTSLPLLRPTDTTRLFHSAFVKLTIYLILIMGVLILDALTEPVLAANGEITAGLFR